MRSTIIQRDLFNDKLVTVFLEDENIGTILNTDEGYLVYKINKTTIFLSIEAAIKYLVSLWAPVVLNNKRSKLTTVTQINLF